MSLLPALGSRHFPAPTLGGAAAQTDSGGKAGNAGNAGASALMGRLAKDAVSLSQNGIDLSAQGMSDRVAALGSATVDVAQNFMSSFTQQLLGDKASGATMSFESIDMSAQAGFAGAVQHTAGANGGSDAAAFSLSESSHFVGKGKITTADGQTFEFEVDVDYQSEIDAAAASGAAPADATAAAPSSRGADATTPLPTLQLPDIKFPGSLNDLFKLLGQQLQSQLTAAQPAGVDANPAGTLKLRLLNLINNSTALTAKATTTQDQADTQARAKALADAYGATPVAAAAAAPAGVAAPAAAAPVITAKTDSAA